MNERDDRGLIYLVLKKLNLKDKEDEYYDVGLIGLAKGIKTYDETKGYQRSTYYVKCIKNEICKELCFENRDKRLKDKYNISLNSYISKENEEDELGDFIEDKKQNTEKEAILNIQKEDLKYCVENFLTKRQKEIIIKYYFEGLSADEISVLYGITRQMVHVHLNNAYKRLRLKMTYINKIKEEEGRKITHERRRAKEDRSLEELFGF